MAINLNEKVALVLGEEMVANSLFVVVGADAVIEELTRSSPRMILNVDLTTLSNSDVHVDQHLQNIPYCFGNVAYIVLPYDDCLAEFGHSGVISRNFFCC